MNRNCLRRDLEGAWKRTTNDAPCASRSFRQQRTDVT